MRVFLVPAGAPVPQEFLPQLPRIQEISLTPELLQQTAEQLTYTEEESHLPSTDPQNDVNHYNKDFEYYYRLNFPSGVDINLIPTRPIQKFTFLHRGKQAVLAIDSGGEGNCMTEEEAIRLGIPILPLEPGDKIPNQADGQTKLVTIGSAKTTFSREGLALVWHGYVVKSLAQPIICGTPFIEVNSIVQLLHRKAMTVQGKTLLEDPPFCPPPLPFAIHAVDTSTILSQIKIGADVPTAIKDKLNAVHACHQPVFDGNLLTGYNGRSGDFDVTFNWLNDLPPPPHKGSTPSYQSKLEDKQVLQAKIDELERNNIVAKAVDLNMEIKYASPCMLGKKNSAKSLSAEEYNKLSISEKANKNRFILSWRVRRS